MSGSVQEMGIVPSQWISWDHTHVDDALDGRPEGQFLYALKDTPPGERQLVLEGGSVRGLIGLVDFAGHNRKAASIYYAWGSVTYLQEPVAKSTLDADPVLRRAFSNRQGRAKRLAPEVAERLEALMGGFVSQRFPSRDPGRRDDLDIWLGAHGREPEFLIQQDVIAVKRVWRKMGFRSAPRSGHRLQNGRYPDLMSDDGVVGEVKNVIGPNWGPNQLAGYIRQLRIERPEIEWRGVLIHGAQKLSPAARKALNACGEDITVWSVDESPRASQQYP
jgi:hypothetical protein